MIGSLVVRAISQSPIINWSQTVAALGHAEAQATLQDHIHMVPEQSLAM